MCFCFCLEIRIGDGITCVVTKHWPRGHIECVLQVDQQALTANKAKGVLGASKDKENAPVQLETSPISPKGSLGKLKPTLNRSILGANSNASNMMENLSITTSGDVDMQKEAQMAAMVCSLENKDACLSCGS